MEKRGEASASEPNNESGNSMITVTVKFAGRSIPLEIALDSTVADLKLILQGLTNVLPRGQKLIFKGRVLEDQMTLRESEINHKSKIMLMATQGLHQGDGPIKKAHSAVATSRWTVKTVKGRTEIIDVSDHLERWKITRIIALSNFKLKVIPNEVWSLGPFARVLDLSYNSLEECPPQISKLWGVQKLLLDANSISDESICWDELGSLKALSNLSLNKNRLKTVPSALGSMTCLKKLELGNNEITCLPTEIGLLASLQVLKVNNNRLHVLPASIGGCISLVEIDLSSNLLVELPETFGNLKDLKSLNLGNNGLGCLPSSLFKSCVQLSTLDLHGTQITMDILRQIEGWEDFDNRRRLKHQKQLDFRVHDSADFDEGADKRLLRQSQI